MSLNDHPIINIGFPWIHGPSLVTSEEKEPNDQFETANLIAVGTKIRGLIESEQDRDFFKFKTSSKVPADHVPKIRIILRKPSPGGFDAVVEVYNNVEQNVTQGVAGGEDSVSFAFETDPNAYYYVKISPWQATSGPHRGAYELEVKEE